MNKAVERLIGDKHAQEQIGDSARRLGAAYRRARTLRGQEAVQDKKLYDHVREAAASLTEAARRVAGQPEPEPKKRRRLPAVVILASVALLVRAMHRQQQAGPSGPPAPASPA